MKIDKESWKRIEHYHFFEQMSNPFYMVTFTLDVTTLCTYVKKHHLSFYYAMIYLSTKAINQIDDFLYYHHNDDIFKLDHRVASFTDMKKDSDLFYIVTFPFTGTLEEFCHKAKYVSHTQTSFFTPNKHPIEMIYYSCLPWIEMTALSNERDMDVHDAIPRISWGKYVENDGHKTLHIAIELNHKFVDGVHIGYYHDRLKTLINELPQ